MGARVTRVGIQRKRERERERETVRSEKQDRKWRKAKEEGEPGI